MARHTQDSVPPVAAGLASLVLGMIGLMLFFLPIVGMPVAASGCLLGIAGMVRAGLGHHDEARMSVAGFVVSCVALGTGFALDYAPIGYEPSNAVPRLWQTAPGPPFVPPPARP